MKGKTEADRLVDNYSEAAKSQEAMKRNMERTAEQTARDEKEAIANIYEAAGKIKAMHFVKTQADFFNLVMLKHVKDAKEYRTRFGMSWEKFCEHVGVSRRWVDEQLVDLKPFKSDFLEALLQFSGVPISKIKYLGESVSGGNSAISENAITYNGETIPLDAEHKDDIQALLEALEETHKREKEESEATIRTKDRLIKAKEDVIKKMDRELNRLQKAVKVTDLTEEEQDAVNLLYEIQNNFVAGLSDIKKKIKPGDAPEVALRQLYFLYIFISKVCMEERLALHEFYQNADEVPWEITEMELPPAEILIDNLPLTAGLGKAYKEKMDRRQAQKGK